MLAASASEIAVRQIMVRHWFIPLMLLVALMVRHC